MQSKTRNILAFLFFVAVWLLPAIANAQTPTPTATPGAPAVPTLPSVTGKPLLGNPDVQYRQVTVGGVTTIVPIPLVAPSTKAARVEQVTVPLYIQKLYEVTRTPVARLSKMRNTQIWELFKTYAQQLRIDVYELQPDGTYRQTGWRNRPPVGPKPQPIVPGGPDRSMDTDTIYTSYRPGQTNALTLDYLQFANAISWARNYMESLTQFADTRGFTKEFPGFPLWMDTLDGPFPTIRQIGQYHDDRDEPFARIENYAIGDDFEIQGIRWEDGDDNDGNDLFVHASRLYYPYNSDRKAVAVQYQVTWQSWNGLNSGTDLYLDTWLMMGDVGGKFVGYTTALKLSRDATYVGGLPSMRYTYNHATQLGRYTYHMQGRATEANKLWNSLSEKGIWNSLYAPLYGDNTALPESWFFTNDPYAECNDLATGTSYAPHPWGVYPSVLGRKLEYYPHESKVCVLGRPAYLAVSRLDTLVPMVQAIHVLNKYGDADHSYTGALGLATTPRKVARAMENYAWNGYGIRVYGKNLVYASGVRTDVFSVLETLLGYKYGDAKSREFADKVALGLLDTQWGIRNNAMYKGETLLNGVITRPPHTGGQMTTWVRGSSYLYAYGIDDSFLGDVVDSFSTPREVEGVIPTNAESTGLFLQALRVYMWYKYNVLWGAGLMP